MSNERLYPKVFYAYLEGITRSSAEAIVPVLMTCFSPKSVLDVGCGTGTFLAAFAQYGAADIMGLDGDHVTKAQREIPEECFQARDLAKPFDLGRRFDLVVSLEVAEHLPEAAAEGFVASLVAHAPLVVFSAAIPKQGGIGHINERWASYWARLFKAQGLDCYDAFRRHFWRNKKVAWWYRQNLLVFAGPEAAQLYPHLARIKPTPIGALDLVHPELWSQRV